MQRSDQKRIFKLIPHQEALNRLISSINIVPSFEELAINDAVGRVLACNIVSEVNIPERNRAVFDGYIIHPEDTQDASIKNPKFLTVVGKIFPGDEPIEITRNQTIFTATGGTIPEGDYGLIKVENTRRIGGEIEIRSSIKPGENVALIGEDVKKGKMVFKAGHILRPQDVGLLVGIGIRAVKVTKKPKVAIISIGDELVPLNEDAPNKVVNNYALIISSLVTEFGGKPTIYDIIEDDLEKIKQGLSKALKETDIVLTISGCSVGPKDLVPDAINLLGKPGLVFHGIKLSPGKVVGAGIINKKLIIMLPGHIASTFAGFYLFTVPILSKFAGLKLDGLLPVFKARLSMNVKRKSLYYFLRVRLKKDEAGLKALPVYGGSGLLKILVESNGFSIVPTGKELKEGDIIDVTLYSQKELGYIIS
jgi:molybdopterin molybdotransferase